MSKRKTKKCVKCQNEYSKKLLNCPICGQIDERRALQLKAMEIKKQSSSKLTHCSACNKEISNQAETCPHCGHTTGVHVCPKCRSTDTKVISGASKAVSIAMWGILAANKVKSNYQCKKCGHKF